MRKSVSWLPGNEGGMSSTRVFGVALDDVVRTRTACGHNVPLLVHRIVLYIEEQGRLDLEGLFLVNGNRERVDWLRQRYDSGEGVELEEAGDVRSAVSLLRRFLQELPEPLITTEIQTHLLHLHQDCSSEEEVYSNMRFLLQQLPELSLSLLRFLCGFLGRMASLHSLCWPPGSLAATFAPDLFHLWPGGEDPRERDAARVLTDLLLNQEVLLDSDSEDERSSTNDYSSVTEQEDERVDEQGEELPEDSEKMLHSGEGRVSQGMADGQQDRKQPSPGHAHLQLFPGIQLEEPVPAYQRRPGDGGGMSEAQLSPLASRLLPLPLLTLDGEESSSSSSSSSCSSSSSSSSSSSHLLAKRFLDFGAHAARRFLTHEPELIHRTHRARRVSLGCREASRASDSSSHQLSKKLQHLKKKMKQFEEQFERERNYKPSHGDKAANPKVLKWMTDLTKLRRQIKDARHRAETEGLSRPRSNTLPKSFGSTLERNSPAEVKGQRASREAALEPVQGLRRQDEGWPNDLKKMTKEQLSCEKMKNLLPVSPSSKRRGQTLQPIIEGETAHFCDELMEEEEQQQVEEEGDEGQGDRREDSPSSRIIMTTLDPTPLPDKPIPEENPSDGQSDRPIRDKNRLELRLSANNTSIPELVEQLWRSRSEKKKLRSAIRAFEEEFYQHHGRRVQKEERAALLDEYREYKRIKAKLRLLEVLISKQDSSKSI